MIHSGVLCWQKQQADVARSKPLPRRTICPNRRTLFACWPILSLPSTLRVFLILAPGESIRADLPAAMQGHVVGEAELAGVFTP